VETPTRKRVQASVTGAVASAPETFGEPLNAGEDEQRSWRESSSLDAITASH
jgi:hypothetical protein